MEYTAFTDAPAYTESSIVAECSRVVGFRREPLLSGAGKNKFALLRQPGLKQFATGSGGSGSCRGLIVTAAVQTFQSSTIIPAQRLFGVMGRVFTEFTSSGTGSISIRNIASDGAKVYMASSPTQLAIVSAGHLYVYNLTTGVFQEITSGLAFTNPIGISFLDGFFVLIFASTQQYQVSAANDATTWDPTQVSSVNAGPAFLLSVHELKERLWFFTNGATQSVYNAGGAPFPFLSDISSVYDIGLLAPQSIDQVGDAIFFLGSEHTGEGIGASPPGAYKIEGLTVKKVSNPAIDAIFTTYQNQAQAYGWCYSENGHNCWRVTFPSIDGANNSRTWEYDDSLGSIMGWTETPYFASDVEQAHLGFASAAAFGKTLIGSRLTNNNAGILYDFSSAYLDDAGTNIYRVRRTPHIYNSRKRIYLDRIEFDGNKGIGLQVAQAQNYWRAQSTLQVSYDGGKSFPNQWQLDWGKDGERKARPYKAHMGSGYDIVLNLICTDPVDWMISAVDLETQLGLS